MPLMHAVGRGEPETDDPLLKAGSLVAPRLGICFRDDSVIRGGLYCWPGHTLLSRSVSADRAYV